MAEINLEAEQVVEEEEERPPPEKRNALKGKKGMIIFAAVIVLEAVVLFMIFEMLQGSGEGHAEGAVPDEPPVVETNFPDDITTDGRKLTGRR